MLVKCIKDDGYSVEHLKWIENFPVKGEIYEIRSRVHGLNGLGYLLVEIHNPIMPNNTEPNFSTKRFIPVDDIDINALVEESLNYNLVD